MLLLHLIASVALDQETRVRWTLAEDHKALRLLSTALTMQHLLNHPIVLLYACGVLGTGHDYLRLGRFPQNLIAMISLLYVTCHSDIPADYHALELCISPAIASHKAERLSALRNLLILELGNDRVASRALERCRGILLIAFAVVLCSCGCSI